MSSQLAANRGDQNKNQLSDATISTMVPNASKCFFFQNLTQFMVSNMFQPTNQHVFNMFQPFSTHPFPLRSTNAQSLGRSVADRPGPSAQPEAPGVAWGLLLCCATFCRQKNWNKLKYHNKMSSLIDKSTEIRSTATFDENKTTGLISLRSKKSSVEITYILKPLATKSSRFQGWTSKSHMLTFWFFKLGTNKKRQHKLSSQKNSKKIDSKHFKTPSIGNSLGKLSRLLGDREDLGVFDGVLGGVSSLGV